MPCYLNMCDIFFRHKHLLAPEGIWEFPIVGALNSCGVDIKKSCGTFVTMLFQTFAAFAQQYTPLTRRWCVLRVASCSWQTFGASWRPLFLPCRHTEEYSILQPANPNSATLMYFIVSCAANSHACSYVHACSLFNFCIPGLRSDGHPRR